MAWTDDLQGLLGQVGGALSAPITQQSAGDALGNFGGMIHSGAETGINAAFGLADAPRQFIAHNVVGNIGYDLAKAGYYSGLTRDPAFSQKIMQLHDTGGGAAVWEQGVVPTMPWWAQVSSNVLMDPVTLAGAGVFGDVAKGLEAGQQLGPLSNFAATGARGLQVIGNDLPAGLATKGLGIAGDALRGVVNKMPGDLLELTKQSQLRQLMSNVHDVHSQLLRGNPYGSTPLLSRANPYATMAPEDAALLAKAIDPTDVHPPGTTIGGFDISGQPKGDTYGDVLRQAYVKANTDIQALWAKSNSVNPDKPLWQPWTGIDKRINLLDGEPMLQKIVRDYHSKLGMDVLFANPQMVAERALEKRLSDTMKIKFQGQSTLAPLWKAAFGENALFSMKYHTGNYFGAMVQNLMGGTFNTGTPGEILTTYKLANGGIDQTTREALMQSLPSTQIANSFGVTPPKDLMRGGIHDISSPDVRVTGSATGELARRATGWTGFGDQIGRAVGKPYTISNNFAQALEQTLRSSLWGDTLERRMTQLAPGFDARVQEIANRAGVGVTTSLRHGLDLPAQMGPAEIADHMRTQFGMPRGYADQVGRAYAQTINIAKKDAMAAVNKYQFSYSDFTNLDSLVSKFIPFHYWSSRAINLYAHRFAAHPYLMLNYMRDQKGIEAAQQDPGLSARQKGFFALMQTPLGFSLLMNPETLFGVTKIMGLQDNYTPQGAPETATAMDWARQHGIGFYPWIDSVANIMGLEGNTFEPDFIGIRNKALIGSVVQFMHSSLGIDPATTPYANVMGQARWNVSQLVSQFAPGWMGLKAVPPVAGGSTEHATIDKMIESRVIDNNQGITNADLLEIMTDRQNPEYRKAYAQVAKAGLIDQAINWILPGQYRMREASYDVRQAQINTVKKQADADAAASGVASDPYHWQPTQGDLQFGANYKALTGKDWKPTDYQDAMLLQRLARAPDEAKPFIVQEQQYNNLGDATQSAAWQTYQNLRYGMDNRTFALDDKSRLMVAQAWADKNGVSTAIDRMYNLRTQFEATHPDFARFKQWQQQMESLKTTLGGNLGEYRRQASMMNPNASQYFQQTDQQLRKDHPNDTRQQHLDRLDAETTTPTAWSAITGMQQNEGGPAAPAPNIQFDPTQQGMAPVQAQPSQYTYTPWAGAIARM